MMPGILPSLLMASTSTLSVKVIPAVGYWPTEAPYRVTTIAEATGGVPPYTYGWNDTGPWPVGGTYGGQVKDWEPAGGVPQDAFVSILVIDAAGNQATASGEIRLFMDGPILG